MRKLVTAILARNEADRYLERVIRRCCEFSDEVLLLDDYSTDETPTIGQRLGCRVKVRALAVEPWTKAWGNETPARSELWDWAAERAEDGWLLVCDADMLLQGDPRPYTASLAVNAWSWVLYDVWDSEDVYRSDGYWQGHVTPRPWMFRPSAVPEGWEPKWGTAGIHCGHCPPNFPMVTGLATDLSWVHLAYLTETDRIGKHAQYLAVKDQLTPQQLAHAESILTP